MGQEEKRKGKKRTRRKRKNYPDIQKKNKLTMTDDMGYHLLPLLQLPKGTVTCLRVCKGYVFVANDLGELYQYIVDRVDPSHEV